jgi:hypothetical protein
MSKSLQWVIGISVVLIVAAVIFSTVWPLFAARVGWTVPGMMGPGYMMGPGHMTGGGGMMGGWGMMPFFGAGMLLWPLLIVGLVVFGAVWLVRNLKTPVAPPAPAVSFGQACAHCGQPLQAGWKACPACGEKV